MPKRYKIEVSMSPNVEDNKYKPFHWMLVMRDPSRDAGTTIDEWCNSGFGWAETPEKAWSDAYEYFKTYKEITNQ